ncbi:MAG: hypothetical protein Q9166_001492 [cf. Caloplaca sp. 2 TL-2023]
MNLMDATYFEGHIIWSSGLQDTDFCRDNGPTSCSHLGAVQLYACSEPLDRFSVKGAARAIDGDLVRFYNGSQQESTERTQLGYRDEAGASLFGALIGYWHYTGGDQYNDLVHVC